MGEHFRQTKLTAWLDQSTPGHRRLRQAIAFLGQYNVSILIVSSIAVIYSMGDFLTSAVATNMGLFESNILLTSFASFFHTSLLFAFAVTKLGIIGATTLTGVVGVRSRNSQMKRLVFIVVAFLAILYMFVTINNAYWIHVG